MLSINFCLPFHWSMEHLPWENALHLPAAINWQKYFRYLWDFMPPLPAAHTYTPCNAGILCSLSMCRVYTLFHKACEFRYVHRALILSSHLPLWFLIFFCILFPKNLWNLGEMICHRCSIRAEHFLTLCTWIGVVSSLVPSTAKEASLMSIERCTILWV